MNPIINIFWDNYCLKKLLFFAHFWLIMTEGNYTYEVELYCLWTHVDDSILLLNPILEKYGYAFVSIGIEELEKKNFRFDRLKTPLSR